MPARWSVLHVVNGLTRGGASHALSALANAQAKRPGASIGVLSLTPADAAAGSLLDGPILIDNARWADVREQVTRANIVHAHVWNAPEIFEFLRRPWPSARLVLWFHVASRAAPQRIPQSLLGQADALVVSASATLAHAPFTAVAARTDLVVPARDLTPFLAIERTATRTECTGGHVGSLDPMRLPENLLDLYSRPALAAMSFDFAGGGPLLHSMRATARRLGMEARTRFRGPVSDMGAFLRDCALLCSPHGPSSYATSDMAVEEAMAAALPPVLLTPEGTSDLVEDGASGFVSSIPETYLATLAALAEDATVRNRIGRQARERARDLFRPDIVMQQFQAIYERVLDDPAGDASRRDLRPAPGAYGEGAEALIFAVGEDFPQFERSLRASTSAEALVADEAILALPGAIWNTAQGGVRHYLSRHPRDPWLGFWSGLGHLGAGAPVHALEAFRKAVDHELPADRALPFEQKAFAAVGRAAS